MNGNSKPHCPYRDTIFFMQLFGLCPIYSFKKWYYAIPIQYVWNVVLVAVVIFYSIVDFEIFFSVYSLSLSETEFFTMSFFAYRLLYHAKTVLISTWMIMHSDKLRNGKVLYCAMTDESLTQSKLLRCCLVNFPCLRLLTPVCCICVALSVFSGFHGLMKWNQIVYSPSFNFNFMTPLLILQPNAAEAPFWVTMLIMVIGMSICTAVDVIVNFLIITVTLSLSFKFKVNASVLAVVHAENHLCEQTLIMELKKAAKGHLAQAELVRKFDQIFAPVLLLQYLSALIGVISCVSLTVRMSPEWSKSGDILSFFTAPFVMLVVVSTLGVLRILTACISLNNQAHACTDILRESSLKNHDQLVKLEVLEFMSRLQEKPITLSAGGFLPLTIGFFVTMIGVLLTFSVLIYQVQDGRLDMESLIKAKQIPKLVDSIRNSILQSLSSDNPNDTYSIAAWIKEQ